MAGNKRELLDIFDLSDACLKDYAPNDRFKYGFPISINEYGTSMKELVLSFQKNFNNRIIIK